MHIALLAGEPSGDQLGAALIRELRKINPAIRFDGVGGEKMLAEGFTSLLPMSDFSVMGISEIITHLPQLISYRNRLFEIYRSSMPDAFIGIDYPEFNLNLEKKLKQIGIYTAHYVCPSVWAWRQNRIKHIKESCDTVLTLFDFEKNFLDQHQMSAVYCGHPLVDIISESSSTLEAREILNLSPLPQYIAILPGSRLSEIKKMLPIFLNTAKSLPKYHPQVEYIIPAVSKQAQELILEIIRKANCNFKIYLYPKKAKIVMQAADAIMLASGTATLEAMLLNRPMLVAYKVNQLTAFIAKRLVQTKHFSLPNLLADHPIVPEFIQNDIHYDEMAKRLSELLDPCNQYRKTMLEHFVNIRQKMKKNGAQTAAETIYQNIMQKGLSQL